MAEAARRRRRRSLVGVLKIVFRSVGDRRALIGLRLVVLHRRASRIALRRDRCPTLPRRQNHFLDRPRIAGHAQNDIVELRSIQQVFSTSRGRPGPSCATTRSLRSSAGDVDRRTGPRLHRAQHLRQSGVRGIDCQLAVLKTDPRWRGGGLLQRRRRWRRRCGRFRYGSSFLVTRMGAGRRR